MAQLLHISGQFSAFSAQDLSHLLSNLGIETRETDMWVVPSESLKRGKDRTTVNKSLAAFRFGEELRILERFRHMIEAAEQGGARAT